MVIPTSRLINADEMSDLERSLEHFDFDNKLLLNRYRGGSEIREKYYDLLENFVLYTPRASPYNAQITVKLGSKHKPHVIVEDILNCFIF